MNKKMKIILSVIAIVLAISGVSTYTYVNSENYLIDKMVSNCLKKNPESPEFCKCKAYTDLEFFNERTKDIADGNEYRYFAIMYQFQGKKLSQYMSRFNVCRIYMSDNDFINRHLESYKKTPFYDTSKDVSCTKEAFEKLDRETKTLVKMLKPDDKSYWNSLISQCLDNYSSDEEFKKSFLRIMYELNKNKLLNLKQEECINNLTHEQLQLIKQNDKKMLKNITECCNANK